MSQTRDERRKKVRADEQKRRDEFEKKMEEPKLPTFEAPATGKIVETPPAKRED